MATIKTLVYFDLEATGLKSSGRPRISELSFVAVNAHEINIVNKKLSEKVKISHVMKTFFNWKLFYLGF